MIRKSTDVKRVLREYPPNRASPTLDECFALDAPIEIWIGKHKPTYQD
jgi:hypothetical protein